MVLSSLCDLGRISQLSGPRLHLMQKGPHQPLVPDPTSSLTPPHTATLLTPTHSGPVVCWVCPTALSEKKQSKPCVISNILVAPLKRKRNRCN